MVTLIFVFIDSSHTYDDTKKEIKAWYPKVKDESILAGHDYNASDVRKAVDEVIPKVFVRDDVNEQSFNPEKCITFRGYFK